jgi:hypothetical protein
VLLEPDAEWNVVGDAAEQAHRRVRVRVDQAGNEHVVRQREPRARRKLPIGVRFWSQRNDAAAVHEQGMPG